MFRLCLYTAGAAGAYVAGVLTEKYVDVSALQNKIKQYTHKTVANADEVAKKIMEEKKVVQEQTPKPLEAVTNIKGSSAQEIQEKYRFVNTSLLPEVFDSQMHIDRSEGNYVNCNADTRPDSQFKAPWLITGTNDPCACDALKQQVLKDIADHETKFNVALKDLYTFRGKLCLPLIMSLGDAVNTIKAEKPVTAEEVLKDARLNKALEALYSFEQPNPHPQINEVSARHYALNRAKLPLKKDAVFKAIPKNEGINSAHKVAGDKNSL